MGIVSDYKNLFSIILEPEAKAKKTMRVREAFSFYLRGTLLPFVITLLGVFVAVYLFNLKISFIFTGNPFLTGVENLVLYLNLGSALTLPVIFIIIFYIYLPILMLVLSCIIYILGRLFSKISSAGKVFSAVVYGFTSAFSLVWALVPFLLLSLLLHMGAILWIGALICFLGFVLGFFVVWISLAVQCRISRLLAIALLLIAGGLLLLTGQLNLWISI